jgi:hypothetical protein
MFKVDAHAFAVAVSSTALLASESTTVNLQFMRHPLVPAGIHLPRVLACLVRASVWTEVSKDMPPAWYVSLCCLERRNYSLPQVSVRRVFQIEDHTAIRTCERWAATSYLRRIWYGAEPSTTWKCRGINGPRSNFGLCVIHVGNRIC